MSQQLFPPPSDDKTDMPHDSKYVVLKKGDVDMMSVESQATLGGLAVEDAVVIRRQDIAAPPILDAYANFYLTIREMLIGLPVTDETEERIAKCNELATYFHDQATAAWETDRKFPT